MWFGTIRSSQCWAVSLVACISLACDNPARKSSPNSGTNPAPDAGATASAVDAANVPADTGTASNPDSGVQMDAATVAPLELVWIKVPAGSYTMGCSSNDTDCYDAEKPPHMVQIAEFEINETEVTQAQYETVIGENPSRFKDCPNCPVELVNWGESDQFCKQVGGRLVHESEWEYAARAGTTTTYECGDDKTCLDGIAWFYDNSGNETHAVRQKTPNAFGLYDMTGNVWEWVQDCWHDDFTTMPPTDGAAWEAEGNGDCSFRVLRGGSWGVNSQGNRVSNRDSDYEENYLFPPSSVGFRCARNPQ